MAAERISACPSSAARFQCPVPDRFWPDPVRWCPAGVPRRVGECRSGPPAGVRVAPPSGPVRGVAHPWAVCCASGRFAPRTPEKIPLFGVRLDTAFHGGVVEDMDPVAHRKKGGMVFLTIRQFAVDKGCDERERGERLPVGRGVGGQ